MGTRIMSKIFLFGLCIALSTGKLKVMFERFEQLLGFNETLYDLRVRKYNRSQTVLNGSIITPQWVDNDVQFSMDLFHSRLGNQQFNHYPMKLPTTGCCSFIDNLRLNYPKQVAMLENVPKLGECPFSPRSMNFINWAFPTEVIPEVMPRGLWKALIHGRRNNRIIVSYFFLLKGYDDF